MFWQGAPGQLLLGFLSNLLFVLVLTAVGVLYVKAVLSRRSRPLRRLLGIGEHLPNKVWIMVSSIYVRKGGAQGVGGRTGFYGPVMNQSEYVSAQLLRDVIRTRPASRPLRALLDQLGLLDTVHDPIECEIVFSPQHVDGKSVGAEYLKEAGVYILVGGPAHNAAVAHTLASRTEKQARFDFRVSLDKAQIIERSSEGEWSVEHDHVTGGSESLLDYFLLQKISGCGPQEKSTVFVCSGLSSLGTAAAVGRLASRWRDLEDKFGDGDFALLYRFENHRRDVGVPAAEDVDKALRTVEEIPHLSVAPSTLEP